MEQLIVNDVSVVYPGRRAGEQVQALAVGTAQFGAFFGFFDLARFEVFAVVGGNEFVLLRLRFGHGFGNQIHGVECGACCSYLGLCLCGLFGFDGGFALRQ